MASTASLLTLRAPNGAQSWLSCTANLDAAPHSALHPLFISGNSILKAGGSRIRNAASAQTQSAARWSSGELKQFAFPFEDVCQGCQRQGLGPRLGMGKRRGLRRGPVAEAVGGQEGPQAGASGRENSNGASGVKLANVSPLSTDQSENSQNGGLSQNGAQFSGREGDGVNGSASNGSASNGAKQALNGIARQPPNGKPAAKVESKPTPLEQFQSPQFGNGVLALPQRLWRRTLRSLSSLELAIGTLLTVAAFSALGTLIEQNKSYQFYINNYPEETPSFGFLSWKVLLDWELDHIYTSWWFLSLLAFLAACLMACTSTRQLPMAKVRILLLFCKMGFYIRTDKSRTDRDIVL